MSGVLEEWKNGKMEGWKGVRMKSRGEISSNFFGALGPRTLRRKRTPHPGPLPFARLRQTTARQGRGEGESSPARLQWAVHGKVFGHNPVGVVEPLGRLTQGWTAGNKRA